MSYSQDLCTVGRSGAYQGQVFGFSTGGTVKDENCERLKLSKYLYDTGMKVASVGILCQDARVFKAMEMAGTPCPYKGKVGKEASTAWANNVEERPDYDEYQEKKEAKEKQKRKKEIAKQKRKKEIAQYERTKQKRIQDQKRNVFIKQCKTERTSKGYKKSKKLCVKEFNAQA
jgi:hypothetical protein